MVFYQNTTYTATYTMTDADISGFTYEWELNQQNNKYHTATLSKAHADLTIDTEAKTVTIALTPTNTNQDAGCYYHELRSTDGSGNQTVEVKGLVTIRPSITADTGS